MNIELWDLSLISNSSARVLSPDGPPADGILLRTVPARPASPTVPIPHSRTRCHRDMHSRGQLRWSFVI
jgi:hypothetical protein